MTDLGLAPAPAQLPPAPRQAALLRYLAALGRAARKLGSAMTGWWGFFPAAVFFASRLAVLGVSGLALTWEPTLQRINLPREWVQPWPPLDGLFRWDAGHYIVITTQGYDTLARTNFWPLYPLICRFVSWSTGLHVQASMLLVSNLASLIGVLLVYRVFEKVEDSKVARTAVLLLLAHPFAFFGAAAYPESLVIAFTAGAVLLALKGRHFLAGLVLAAAVLTRHVAIIAGAALFAARIRQRGPRWSSFFRWDLIGLLLPFAAVGAYSYYLQQRFGDPLAFVTARRLYWDDGFANIFGLSGAYAYSYIPLTVVLMTSAVALWFRNRWLELAPFAVIWMIFVAMISATGLGRHTASCWPAFLPLAWLLSRHPQLTAVVVGFLAMFQGLFIFLFSHHYHVL